MVVGSRRVAKLKETMRDAWGLSDEHESDLTKHARELARRVDAGLPVIGVRKYLCEIEVSAFRLPASTLSVQLADRVFEVIKGRA